MSDETTIAWDTLSQLDDGFWQGWRECHREILGRWRHGLIERVVVQRESDARYFEIDLRIVGGDEGPGYSRDERIPLGREVRPVERTVTAWEPAG